MKKPLKTVICIALPLLLIIASIFLCVNSNIQRTDIDLLEKVREEIGLGEDTALEIIDKITYEKHALIWFKTGNEYQAHLYYPVEFKINKNGSYSYIQKHSTESKNDISFYMWQDGYSFAVNNEKCHYINIIDDKGETEKIYVDSVPFVTYIDYLPTEYAFIDYEGNEIIR